MRPVTVAGRRRPRRLVESMRVVAASGSAESRDDRIRKVKASAVGSECRSYDRVVIHSKFSCVQKPFHRLSTPADIHLVGATRNPRQRDDGDQLEVSGVGLGQLLDQRGRRSRLVRVVLDQVTHHGVGVEPDHRACADAPAPMASFISAMLTGWVGRGTASLKQLIDAASWWISYPRADPAPWYLSLRADTDDLPGSPATIVVRWPWSLTPGSRHGTVLRYLYRSRWLLWHCRSGSHPRMRPGLRRWRDVLDGRRRSTCVRRYTSIWANGKSSSGRTRLCGSGRTPAGRAGRRRTCGMSWACDPMGPADIAAVRQIRPPS